MSNFNDFFPAIAGGLSVIDRQTFTASGTWTKPAGAKLVRVVMCGGGGGGASGNIQTSGPDTGGAGGGGLIVEAFFAADEFDATEPVTVGAGGAGGPPVTATVATTGGSGVSGGHSSFAGIIAEGGYLANGPAASTNHASSKIGLHPYFPDSLSVGAGDQRGLMYRVASGGDADLAYGASGGPTTGADDTTTPTAGTVGVDGDLSIGLGGSGGGSAGTRTGSSSGSYTAPSGADGGIPGGGGGGGGGVRYGSGAAVTTGAGGEGARGEVYVETWG